MGSIVATETSTVTFISVPGVAFTGNWTFLQLVMGLHGRPDRVSIIFVPAYFRGELLTVYQILGVRFGAGVKRLAAGLFLVTRKPRGRGQAVLRPAWSWRRCCWRCRAGRGGPALVPRPRPGGDDHGGVGPW